MTDVKLRRAPAGCGSLGDGPIKSGPAISDSGTLHVMTVTVEREELIFHLERLASPAAVSARAALLEGADFRFWAGSHALSARRCLTVWTTRERIMGKRDPLSERRQWVSDALQAFEAAGNTPIRLGQIGHDDGRHYFLYMTSDLSRCVACL